MGMVQPAVLSNIRNGLAGHYGVDHNLVYVFHMGPGRRSLSSTGTTISNMRRAASAQKFHVVIA